MGGWQKVLVSVAALALAVGLFPTVRAIFDGSASQPAVVNAPAQAARGSGDVFALAAVAAKRALPGTTRVMLVGNSVAYDLAPSFESLAKTMPIAAFNAAITACNFPPLVTATYRNPATNQVFVLRPCHTAVELEALRGFRPAVVLWVVNDAPQPWIYRGRSLQPCAEPYESLYRSSLREEIARFRRAGVTVVLTTQAYVRFVTAGDGMGAASLPDRAVDCNNRLRREVAVAEHVQLVDLFSWTCPHGRCRVNQDGVTLRPDGLHYQGAGGDITARWLIDQFFGK